MEKRFRKEELKTSIIVITGAESTGKSELTGRLASHFHVPYIPEYARNYIETLGRDYDYRDVEIIAEKQVQQLKAMKTMNPPVIFVDTWLIITKIWFEEVFGKIPDWLDSEIVKTRIDLFLVCDTDLPWVPDPVRENGGEKRYYLQKRYMETIQKYGFSYSLVSGQGEIRFQNALHHVIRIL
jgi:NadR type nicotinamide-nucleotide adenylyltransferase